MAQQFGDAETARRNLTAVRTAASPIEDRRKALQTLAAQRRPELVPELPSAIDDPALRVDAIRAVAAFDDDALGKLLIARYPSFSSAEKAEAIQTLASRGRYGRMLTDALATDVDPETRRAAVRRAAAAAGGRRQVRRGVGTGRGGRGRGTGVRALPRSAERQGDGGRQRRERTRSFSAPAARATRCTARVGRSVPDLTGSNRANLEYLLLNVLNPNAEVQDAYQMVVVTTRDGRTLRRQRHRRNRSPDHAARGRRRSGGDRQGRHPVARVDGDVDDAAGLFDALTDREVIDLVAYLRTVEQVKVP